MRRYNDPIKPVTEKALTNLTEGRSDPGRLNTGFSCLDRNMGGIGKEELIFL